MKDIDYQLFLRERINELRVEKELSQYQLSLELGQNKNYIQSISSGKLTPSFKQLIKIIDHFGLTPSQFFSTDHRYGETMLCAMDELQGLPVDDLLLLIEIIRRMKKHEK